MTRRSVPLENTAALARIVSDVNRLTREVGRLTELHSVVAAHGRAIDDLADLTDRLTTAARGASPAAAGTGTRRSAEAGGAQVTLRADGLHHEAGEDDAGAEEPGGAEVLASAWLTVTDPALAIQWLADLSVWVPAVWQPHLLTKTPGCWPWHPAVVAELLVVHDLWDDALRDEGPAALAAWHDRWRPTAARRVTSLMAGCERAEGHHKIAGKEHTYDLAYLDELAEWWATTHGTDPTQTPPGISKEGVMW